MIITLYWERGFTRQCILFPEHAVNISAPTLASSVTKAPRTVKKFLGFTLLPHSGVSLVFTGIAVSVLSGPAPECAQIIQGTIAAAAVINEIIAVIMAKKGFEWAGEFGAEKSESASEN